jgi:hypothetical protein
MGFIDDYLLEMLSITFSLIALFVSLYSLYLKRLDIEKERLAREITFGPIDETISVDRSDIENRDEIPIQLINDTGIPQIVNEIWIKVEQYPKDISDEQYARFKTLMVALTEAGLKTLGQEGAEELLKERLDKRIVGDRTMFMIALMILIVNRIRQDDERDVVVDENLLNILKTTSGSLDDIAKVLKQPENDWMVRKLMIPQIIEMLEDHIRPLMSDNGYPLYRSMKLEVPPEAVKDIDLHLMRFAQRLYDRLDLIGGEFEFLCRLYSNVHKCERMSTSELFAIKMTVEPVDMGTLIGTVEADLQKMTGT